MVGRERERRKKRGRERSEGRSKEGWKNEGLNPPNGGGGRMRG